MTDINTPRLHLSPLTSENEDLKKKLLRVKQQRDVYWSELKGIKEKAKVDNLLKSYVTTRDSCTQTESAAMGWQTHRKSKPNPSPEQRVIDTEKTNKLISMHNQVMRRYEKEVKQNLSHIDTITELNVNICNLEKQLKEEKDKIHQLEMELIQLRSTRSRISGRKKKGERSKVSDSDDDESTMANKMSKECQKLRKENKKLKEELKGLDLGFFEEIEDIKFSLQQSSKLNAEYERTLRKLCKKFGVPYPHPETNVK